MNSNLKFLFRTSGGRTPKKELGIGHIIRCLNLTSSLRRSNVFFLVEDYGGIRSIFEKMGKGKIKFLKKNISLKADIKETEGFIEKNKIDIVIVDKYKVDFRYVDALRKMGTTVLITDLRENNYRADLIINGFVGFENQIKSNKYKTKCLLGPKYQILNPSFQKKNSLSKKIDILATFGGFDETNIIDKLIDFLNSREIKLKTKIILGPATKKTKTVKKYQRERNSWLEIVDQTKDMKKEISKARLGICSGGITTYEMASLNVPFGVICQNEHQLITAIQWEKLSFGTNLGLSKNLDLSKLEKFIEKNLGSKTNKKKTIDGHGSKRAIREIIKSHKMKSRD